MTLDQMITKLLEVRNEYGNLPILGGYLTDDRPPEKVSVLDQNSVAIQPSDGKVAKGVFLE